MKRRAQASIEYLFMAMVILILVAISYRYVRQGSEMAGDAVESGHSTLMDDAEATISSLVANG